MPTRFPRWARAAFISTAIVIALAYGWSSYTQRFVLTNEPDAAKDSGAVRVESSFSQRDLSPNDEVNLNVVITNRSSSTLTNPWVVVETPGLLGDRTLPKIASVDPGERQSNTFELHAGRAQGQFRSRVTVGWTVNGQPVVAFLTPPTVAVRNLPARATWIAAAIQALSKDLALPIIVVILAAIFKRAEEEEKLAREERQRNDDRISETWRLLLPRHHDNATLFYLPLLGAIAQFRTAYSDYAKYDRSVDVRKAFYFFLLVFWRMRRLQSKIGGLHFKNRDGEKVAALTWNIVIRQAELTFVDRALRDIAVDSLATGDDPVSYAVYGKKLEYRSPHRELRERFIAWRTVPAAPQPHVRLALKDIDGLLGFFYALTSFECNRPYEYWYGAKPDFPAEAVESFVRQPLFSEPLLKELRTHLRSYLDAIKDKYEIAEIAWHVP